MEKCLIFIELFPDLAALVEGFGIVKAWDLKKIILNKGII